MIDLIQVLIDGVLFGTTYAVIGVGFALIFGAMNKLNIAYAAASIAGAYVGLFFLELLNIPGPLVFLTAAISSGVIGYLLYLTCFRFIPVDNHLAPLMATVGALIFIDEVIVHQTNGSPQSYPSLFASLHGEVGGFFFRGDLIFVGVLSILSMIGLLIVLFRTRLGLATRAVSQQPIAAQLCGMSVHQVNGQTFVLAGVLGGIAGAAIGASVGILSPLLTMPITVKGLIVTVIGGLGSIPGAFVAGLLVGGLENVFLFYRGVSERDMYVMLLLFAFLALRPGGIFATSAERD
ncbi:MAG: branched-chain amino acid ABC transporter permease [Chloroflexota bacterium]